MSLIREVRTTNQSINQSIKTHLVRQRTRNSTSKKLLGSETQFIEILDLEHYAFLELESIFPILNNYHTCIFNS